MRARCAAERGPGLPGARGGGRPGLSGRAASVRSVRRHARNQCRDPRLGAHGNRIGGRPAAQPAPGPRHRWFLGRERDLRVARPPGGLRRVGNAGLGVPRRPARVRPAGARSRLRRGGPSRDPGPAADPPVPGGRTVRPHRGGRGGVRGRRHPADRRPQRPRRGRGVRAAGELRGRPPDQHGPRLPRAGTVPVESHDPRRLPRPGRRDPRRRGGGRAHRHGGGPPGRRGDRLRGRLRVPGRAAPLGHRSGGGPPRSRPGRGRGPAGRRCQLADHPWVAVDLPCAAPDGDPAIFQLVATTHSSRADRRASS